MLLALPLDFVRLTFHTWHIAFESFHFRSKWDVWEHPCIFCRDLDKSCVPRKMSAKIRYRNLWMIRWIQPELGIMYSRKKGRPLPVCHTDSGVVRTHRFRILLTCLLTSAVWAGLLYGLIRKWLIL